MTDLSGHHRNGTATHMAERRGRKHPGISAITDTKRVQKPVFEARELALPVRCCSTSYRHSRCNDELAIDGFLHQWRKRLQHVPEMEDANHEGPAWISPLFKYEKLFLAARPLKWLES
ncbi:predicted protein [Histoplasma capsulatum G186AR]|uniref:Uncharacterized protein n=1 Tax=Ajellomyces capsulatus (strain G186AR / H82 / ATCC MYA-2454 / RMSCC 2432) TaxID=447093 RepID=C0NMX8_AJECG|nr:uncharacterized protein HCBG_04105 [Histoplasma capsulatum G186AR]EEH07226.1 predicted protein [Histoplasma capsulatum G186AR]